MKCALFVEGQSEMLFVAHFLKTYFDYDGNCLYIESHERIRNQINPLGYPQFGVNREAENYYMIVNVGNDNSTTSFINTRFRGLISSGYQLLVGLRDVYGNIYRDKDRGRHKVDPAIIRQMYEEQSAVIRTPGIETRLQFAVMEFEAWMLALMEIYLVGRGIDIKEVIATIGYDFTRSPEQIFHPANVVKDVYQAIGGDYDKHSHDTEGFLSDVSKNDYIELFWSGRSPSFNRFVWTLLGGNKLPQ